MNSSRVVAIVTTSKPWIYPTENPFLPDESYLEFKGRVAVGEERNITYSLFRQLIFKLGMDIDHYSTPDWNPFGDIILPGQKVLIKPNLVRHIHLGGGDYNAVVTHSSLVRCVLDYVALALKGKGEITVGDAPVQSADWSKILERTGLKKVCDDVSKTWEIPVRLVDFRLWSVQLDDHHCVVEGNALKGDQRGYVAVDLGKRSLLAPLGNQSDKFRVTNYDCGEMKNHHNETTNEYLIPQTVLDADVVINLPKLKTHRKVGLTGCLKNIVGINGHKDWLPHHRCGSVEEGGDEYLSPSLLKRLQNSLREQTDGDSYFSKNIARRFAIRVITRLIRHTASDPYSEGSWYGNDTLWRTVLDLNRVLVYADQEGVMTETPQRKCLNIVDAIIAGEGEGPMEPDSRPCGLLIGGVNPIAVDAVLAKMIGFDYNKIPLIARSLELQDLHLPVLFHQEEIKIKSNQQGLNGLNLKELDHLFNFIPPAGWKGHIEA